MSEVVAFRQTSRGSLLDAYPTDRLRAFVDKLRQLAVVTPTTCGILLRVLDDVLAGMLADADVTTCGTLSRPRARLLSRRGLELFEALDNLTRQQFERMVEDMERASTGGGAQPEAGARSAGQ